MSKDKKACYIGTPRSQRSLLAERDLKIALEKVRASVLRTEEKAGDLEGVVKRLTEKVTTQGRIEFQEGLDKAIADLARIRGRIAPYKAEAVRLEAEIQSLQPSQAEIEARRVPQREFLSLAANRLECDRRAAPLIQALRQILSERAKLSGEMEKAARSFDLPVYGESLDASRVERLLAFLPESILPESERWHGLFFGNAKVENTYVVVTDWLMLPETFSSTGIHTFGDRVQLAEEDARVFLKSDRRNPKGRFPSDMLPPDLMAEEDFQRAVAAAEAKGHSVQSELSSAHFAHCTETRRKEVRQTHEALWGLNNKSHPFVDV